MQSVTSRTVLLSLGANLGDRQANILRAIGLLMEYTQAVDFRISGFAETDPVGYEDQPKFINCAVCFSSNLAAEALLGICKRIEAELGRLERPRWHEREIDIDIILLGSETFQSALCTVPHPRMHERLFVLVPAAEIAPDMVHPILGVTINDMLHRLLTMPTKTAEQT